MSSNREPEMGKNFWIAMALSMLILVGYPFFLRWLNPQGAAPSLEPAPLIATHSKESAPENLAPLSPPEGPFIEKTTPPAVVLLQNQFYKITFSTLGASVSQLSYEEDHSKGAIRNIFYDGNPAQPGLLGLKLLHEKEDLNQMIFKVSRQDRGNNLIEFMFEKAGEYRVTKRYQIQPDLPVIYLDVLLENLSPREKNFPVELRYGLQYELKQNEPEASFEAVVFTDKLESANLGKISKKGFLVSKEIGWAGFVRKYFTFLVKPDWKAVASQAEAEAPVLWSNLTMEPLTVASGKSAEHRFLIYAGPQRYEVLKGFNMGFENVLFRGFFGIFKVWLLLALKFCNQFTHNFGWAIILVTIALKVLFTPLTHMSFESMKRMQALQPKLKSIQERYKSDPAKLNREMMGLYKRNRVNPMGGCLPMVLQIPIFIAFYQVLSDGIEMKGASFLGWIHDLSEPDRLFLFPMTLPLIGNSFNLLPLLMLGSMFWQQKLTPQAGATPEQTKIMNFMPLIFGFVFYSMPSGLVLYWFVNNVLSIIHQIFVKRMVVVLHHEDRE